MYIKILQRNKDELLKSNKNEECDTREDGGNIRHRGRVTRETLMKKSSQLTDDLLTVTRMIQDNTEKSTKTIDQLGKYLIFYFI